METNNKTNLDWLAYRRYIQEPLSEETKYLIIEQLKIEHRRRYSVTTQGKYRKTYDCDKLWDDLLFVLNHLHIKPKTHP